MHPSLPSSKRSRIQIVPFLASATQALDELRRLGNGCISIEDRMARERRTLQSPGGRQREAITILFLGSMMREA